MRLRSLLTALHGLLSESQVIHVLGEQINKPLVYFSSHVRSSSLAPFLAWKTCSFFLTLRFKYLCYLSLLKENLKHNWAL